MKRQTTALILKISVFVFALLFGFSIALTHAFKLWEIQINQYLNIRTSYVEGASADDMLFKSKYDKIEDLIDAKSALIKEIGREGAVLLKNNGALPLNSGKKVSLFSRNSTNMVYGAASGGGNIQFKSDDLKTVFKSVGLQVNETLWNYYAGIKGNVRISGSSPRLGEPNVSEYPENVKNSYSSYNDAAFVILSRAFGEGMDAVRDPSAIRDGDGVHNILQIQDVERGVIAEAKKASDTVIVLLNSDNPMEVQELEDDPDIDAILWIGGQGVWGLYGVADIIVGNVSPSGHLTDTYAVSNESSPATVNSGNFVWANSSQVGNEEGAKTYLVYQEGVYVGYKYYETRYEDTVLGQGNADSTAGTFASTAGWNYSEEVTYSFGYGMSYTTFSRKVSNLVWNEEDKTVSIDVTVKNTGNKKGKDVLQLYVNTPYTQYDIDNKVEKPSVKLIGYEKTDELAIGEEKKYTVSAKLEHVASYDYTDAKTYILDPGTYYFAVGNGAHDALNNILAKKGKTVADGMDHDGDVDQVATYEKTVTDGDVDKTTCATSDYDSNVAITNRLEFADINSYGLDITYLSRNDWEGTWTGPLTGLNATAQMIADFAIGATYKKDAAASNPSSIRDGVDYNNKSTNHKFKDLYGKDYDDPIWDELISQLSLEDICMTVAVRNSGGLASIEMPMFMQFDGPAGIYGAYQTSSMEWAVYAVMYNMNTVLSSAFNKDLAYREGVMFGEDGLWTGFQSVWGPGCNTHRTPYSGRNVEYYSEDGILAYYCAREFSKGTLSRGLSVGPKHMAFNDQETNRGGVATFTNEQAARELYLRAFEGPLADGKGLDTMVGKNRLGCFYVGAATGFINGIVRTEWAYNGKIVSDSTSGGYADGPSSVIAGLTQMDTADVRAYYEDTLSPSEIVKDKVLFEAMKEAVHHNLYLWAQTSLMNGLNSGKYVTVMPWYQQLSISLNVVFGVLAVGGAVAIVLLKVLKPKKKEEEAQNA